MSGGYPQAKAALAIHSVVKFRTAVLLGFEIRSRWYAFDAPRVWNVTSDLRSDLAFRMRAEHSHLECARTFAFETRLLSGDRWKTHFAGSRNMVCSPKTVSIHSLSEVLLKIDRNLILWGRAKLLVKNERQTVFTKKGENPYSWHRAKGYALTHPLMVCCKRTSSVFSRHPRTFGRYA